MAGLHVRPHQGYICLCLCLRENQGLVPIALLPLPTSLLVHSLTSFNSLLPNQLMTFVVLAPQVTPMAFQGFNSSSTSIVLSWDPIPPEQVAGILRNFHITYRPLDTADNTTYNITLPITELTFEITNLRKYTNYSFDIKGATKFIGAATEPIIVTTDQDGTSRLFLLLH